MRFVDFSFFSIWFSVFVKNTGGFSVLVSNVVFGFSFFFPYLNLFWFRSLFDWTDSATKENFRKLVPKNDHVKNKDQQDPSAVPELTKQSVIDELGQTWYFCQTIIPELNKFTQENPYSSTSK